MFKSRIRLINEEEYSKKFLLSQVSVKNFLKNDIFLAHEPEEVVILIGLSNQLEILNYFEVSRGTIDMSHVTGREVTKRICLTNAAKMILAHNHPSNSAIVSNEDIIVTKNIKKLGEILGIELIDSCIITPSGDFISLSERNLLNN